jgi:hypothetical protein
MAVIGNLVFKLMLVSTALFWKIYIAGWISRQYSVRTCPWIRPFQLLIN